MKHSESVVALAAALVKAQTAIQAVVKDKVGKIETKTGRSYEYNYSDLGSVIECVKGPLNDNGIAFIQCPRADDKGVTVATTLLHRSGEWLEDELWLPVASTTPQAYGSAITYCKRYSLQSMTGLPSEDDDGKKAGDSAGHAPAPPPKQEITAAELEVIKKSLGRATTKAQLRVATAEAFKLAEKRNDRDAHAAIKAYSMTLAANLPAETEKAA